MREQGILLVTGPTGSGKTTTLYAALNTRRGESVNIVTVEDPVEYRLSGVNQVQVNEKQGLTFAGVLRSVLRQDPDVLLVGEIRDQETADDCLPGGDDGTPRAVDAAHQRRHRRDPASAEHWRRAVPRCRGSHRCHRSAPRAPNLSALPLRGADRGAAPDDSGRAAACVRQSEARARRQGAPSAASPASPAVCR